MARLHQVRPAGRPSRDSPVRGRARQPSDCTEIKDILFPPTRPDPAGDYALVPESRSHAANCAGATKAGASRSAGMTAEAETTMAGTIVCVAKASPSLSSSSVSPASVIAQRSLSPVHILLTGDGVALACAPRGAMACSHKHAAPNSSKAVQHERRHIADTMVIPKARRGIGTSAMVPVGRDMPIGLDIRCFLGPSNPFGQQPAKRLGQVLGRCEVWLGTSVAVSHFQ